MCMQNEDTNLCYKFFCEQQSNMLYLSFVYYILYFVCIRVFFFLSFFLSFFFFFFCVYFSQFAKKTIMYVYVIVWLCFISFFSSSDRSAFYIAAHTNMLFYFSHFFSLLFLFQQNINDDQLKYEIE